MFTNYKQGRLNAAGKLFPCLLTRWRAHAATVSEASTSAVRDFARRGVSTEWRIDQSTMWRASALLCFLLSAQCSSGALVLQQKRDTPAVVALGIQRNDIPDPVGRDKLRRKRDQTVSQSIDNEETLYFCNVTIGTPEQSLRLILDTGSSDLWCNAANSTLCSSRQDPCQTSGYYDPDSSSSYAYISSDFNISYADGSSAAGVYASDTLHIGGVSIRDFQFGIGYASSSAEGVLGIGYPSNEALVGRFGDKAYPNLPQSLVQNDVIQSSAYSLWLNDLEANTGSILFGGVDTEKYHGDLQTLPIQTVNGGYSEFIIALTAISLNTDSQNRQLSSDELPAAVLLDSGSSLSYLPDAIVDDIYNDFGVTYEPSTGAGYAPCSLAQENINITFTFSSPAITVGIDELIIDSGDLRFWNGERACLFGIVPAGESTSVLGDTFLRSAYVVYDLANNEISIANTKFNSTESNILEIGTGDDAVPSATKVVNPVTSVVAVGSGARIGGPSETGFTVTSTSTSAATALGGPTQVPKHLAFVAAMIGYILAL
ncbi:aspartic peptidase domain-containing protein [Aspergillus granulosus]|uniref:Aspartic peptidase domain-containing protein n=1 Tax=Aspergillus granulosus TaxID=176169 RepID=A0ABR4H0Q0_9EURO